MMPDKVFLVDMRPKKLQNQGVCGVLIHNVGRQATTFSVVGQATNKDLVFEPLPESVQMQAGQRGALCVRVRVARRPLLGFIHHLPFALQVTNGEGQQEVVNGHLDIYPYIPLQPLFKATLVILGIVLLSLAAILMMQGYWA